MLCCLPIVLEYSAVTTPNHHYTRSHPLPQVRAIIGSFGTLKAFTLVRDASGASTGHALAEFADPCVLGAAMAGLSAMAVGETRLQVVRAANTEHVVALQALVQQQQMALVQRLTGQKLPEAAPAVGAAPAPAVAPAPAAAPAAAGAAAPPSPPPLPPPDSCAPCVVRLERMVTRDELLADEDYEDILDDTLEEVVKYGPLKQVR
jgi:hypothetical protein